MNKLEIQTGNSTNIYNTLSIFHFTIVLPNPILASLSRSSSASLSQSVSMQTYISRVLCAVCGTSLRHAHLITPLLSINKILWHVLSFVRNALPAKTGPTVEERSLLTFAQALAAPPGTALGDSAPPVTAPTDVDFFTQPRSDHCTILALLWNLIFLAGFNVSPTRF